MSIDVQTVREPILIDFTNNRVFEAPPAPRGGPTLIEFLRSRQTQGKTTLIQRWAETFKSSVISPPNENSNDITASRV